MMKFLFQTNDSAAPLIARVVLGVVMFPHGAQKMLGWFGGHGFSATMASLTGGMQLPAFLAFLVILAEFAGSLGLIVGLLSRGRVRDRGDARRRHFDGACRERFLHELVRQASR